MKPVTSLVLGAIFCAVPAQAAEPFVDLSFDDACTRAAAEGKLVFIEFVVPNDAACEDFDRETWSDVWIVEVVRDKSIALRIDAEQHVALTARFGVTRYPTLLLLKPDGSIVDRLAGERDPGTFLYEFHAALAGKPSLTRAREIRSQLDESDPTIDMRYADELVLHRNYAEALEIYLRCFDVGRDDDRHFWGTRAGTLAEDIARLGTVYPPARQALLDRRDQREKLLLDGQGGYIEFAELDAVNRALADESRTLQVYDRLPEIGPARKDAFPVVFDGLLEARRYATIVAHAADPHRLIERQIESAQQAAAPSFMTRRFLRGHAIEYDEYVHWIRQRPVETAADWVEVYAGAGDTIAARKLVRRIMEYDDSSKTIDTLLAHARRAGNPEVVSYVEQMAPSTPPDHE
jgi:hypothetical protein